VLDFVKVATSRKVLSDFTQWDSVRKYRTLYSKNHAKATPQANLNPLILGDDKGKSQRFVQDGCSSYWYSRFSIGWKNCIGQDWRPNKALSTELILSYLRQIQLKVVEAETLREENCWLVLAVYSVITYVVSLRGLEGFLLDLGGLRLHTINDNKRSKYFLILLMGKVKGECHHRCHLLTCCYGHKAFRLDPETNRCKEKARFV
jgi:hypothetical protein